jgi:hypothetical protein
MTSIESSIQLVAPLLIHSHIHVAVRVYIHVQHRIRLCTLLHIRFHILLSVATFKNSFYGSVSLSEMVLPTFQRLS